MTGIHRECLLICHCCKILHYKTVLSPVLEDGSVASVNYEFVRMLCHPLVQIVLYHSHNGCGIYALARIFIYRACIYLVIRPVTVHIDSSVEA